MRLTSSSWEPVRKAVLRRFGTIPMIVVLTLLVTALLPLILLVALVGDLFRYVTRRLPFPLTRLALFGWLFLLTDLIALIALLLLGLVTGFGLWRKPFLERTFALQTWWAHQHWGAFTFLFGITVETEGEEHIAPGPIFLFMRHASMGDVALPNVIATKRNRIRLRYVLKNELLLSPAIDIAGNRIPNHFVRRGSGNAGEEIDRIGRLAERLESNEGVIIYPEGTRFSEEKRERVLASLERRDSRLAARARRLHHTLPPQLGGPLALLQRRPETDVVFLAHVGLDGLAEVKDFYGGGLVGLTVKVAFWRVPHSEIPRAREELTDWLFEQWVRVDEWVGAHKEQR